jgi:hypothetical protein
MANKKQNKTTKPKGEVKEEETKVDETVVDETVEEETKEEEAEEETKDKEEAESEVETEDASGKVTRYGVYLGENVVAIYNSVNHGKDFVKLAKARAERVGGEARPYADPSEPVLEKTVVNIVNASNSLIRQFSLSAHGKNYEKLAADYIEKYGLKRGYRVQE